ncbi:luc7-like protein 3 [Papaver somniferum]|uniref:luc7-like protein 3 n=1 Tax=Papaver somniferum TaxID=3469 RepID=UPI000E703D0C|nr:luc7-like protein 3 [Papaver somniferum]
MTVLSMKTGSESVDGNIEENIPVVPPSSTEYEQAKVLALSLKFLELQRLRTEIQAEIDRHAHELIRQREEQERIHRREEEKLESLYVAWFPKYLPRCKRKDEKWAEKHSKCKRYDSATKSDSEAPDEGFEYPVEKVDTSELDSYAAEDKARMEKYHERKLRSIFDFERANPKIFARTMQEGEEKADDEEMLEKETNEEKIGEDTGDDDDSEDSSSPDNTSPASSDSEEEWHREEEGWNTDEDDY